MDIREYQVIAGTVEFLDILENLDILEYQDIVVTQEYLDILVHLGIQDLQDRLVLQDRRVLRDTAVILVSRAHQDILEYLGIVG